MFLRTQHFQQADRWTEHLVHTTFRFLAPYPWGITELKIDQSVLAMGQFSLTRLSGILPDGTTFVAPIDADLPAPLILDGVVPGTIVYLVLPLRRSNRAEFNSAGNESAHLRLTRSSYEALDTNWGVGLNAPIDVGRLDLRLLKTGSELAGFAHIGLARITEVRADNTIVLDPDYIAPSLNCAAEPRLLELMSELLSMVRHRAETIADHMGNIDYHRASEIRELLLLNALNRADAMLTHINANAHRIHPLTLFEFCIQLAGELATFSSERKRVNEFATYRHDDLQATFSSVISSLRLFLSVVIGPTATLISFSEREHGMYVGTINDRTLLKDANFVLSVQSEFPEEEMRQKIPAQIKVGPVERISELVNVALPGIPVRPLSVLPRQLPYRQKTTYFEFDKRNSLWSQLTNTGGIALHLAGEFPNISMELWAIRE